MEASPKENGAPVADDVMEVEAVSLPELPYVKRSVSFSVLSPRFRSRNFTRVKSWDPLTERGRILKR